MWLTTVCGADMICECIRAQVIWPTLPLSPTSLSPPGKESPPHPTTRGGVTPAPDHPPSPLTRCQVEVRQVTDRALQQQLHHALIQERVPCLTPPVTDQAVISAQVTHPHTPHITRQLRSQARPAGVPKPKAATDEVAGGGEGGDKCECACVRARV